MTDTGLFQRVTNGGFCIGCGACAARTTGQAKIEMDALGMYRAVLRGSQPSAPEDFAAICPFSGNSANEDKIAADLFTSQQTRKDPHIGSYVACYAGGALEAPYRANGSSGGLTSWLLCALLDSGQVDGIVHVGPQENDTLFGYRISRTTDEVRAAAKSRYYPVEMSQVLRQLRRETGRFAVVGVPCFVKAANLLRRNDPEMADRIAVTVGIFCGHLKSARFAEYLAGQIGVARDDISAVNFRRKYLDRPSYAYGFEARTRDGQVKDRPMAEIYGNNWGYGFFKYDACNACDDVAAETADVAFGDAWLPGFVEDPMGTNVVVVRQPEIGALLTEGARAGRIELHEITATDVAKSQEAGLRDRREGLAFRLAQLDASGRWRPEKRVGPNDALPVKRKRIYEMRQQIARTTHEVFAQARETGDATFFDAQVRPLTTAYDALYRPSVLVRTRRLVGRIARKILKQTRALLNS